MQSQDRPGYAGTCFAASRLACFSLMASFSARQVLILAISAVVGLVTGAAGLGPVRLL